MVITMGLRELRQNAREAVNRANSGDRVEITDRGRVVALLVAPEPGRQAVDALITTGELVRPESGSDVDLATWTPTAAWPAGMESPSDRLAAMRDGESHR